MADAAGLVVLPSNIKPIVPTTLGWDNIDRNQETLTGQGTSHRINGIVVQPFVRGSITSTCPMSYEVPKRQSSIKDVMPENLPVYNASAKASIPTMVYEEVYYKKCWNKARMKNLVWLVTRLHAQQNQPIPGWTGFNIRSRQNVTVTHSSIGYLPTINGPASDMATVYEIFVQSHKIMKTLDLKEIILVFDQALYAKAMEIKWKHEEKFSGIILRLGTFHTICKWMAVIGKWRFQDAGLRDLCIEASLTAEGSASKTLEGRSYNRGVRVHKLVYEAFLRIHWRRFSEQENLIP